MTTNYPILEYDNAPNAIIEPHATVMNGDDVPHRCVLTFFQKVIDDLQANGRLERVSTLRSEIGDNPVYRLDVTSEDTNLTGTVAVAHPGVGGPLSAAFLEELIALGCREFIMCGGAGVLDRDIAVGHLVVPETAMRDEGTSYHYLPPSREVAAHPEAVTAINATLDAHDIPYVQGKTWTTDAIYRETPGKVAHRREEGCITVEMEAASCYAVAQFRNVRLGLLLYGGDDVSGDVWDHRGWHKQDDTRERLFWLAAEAVLRLSDETN